MRTLRLAALALIPLASVLAGCAQLASSVGAGGEGEPTETSGGSAEPQQLTDGLLLAAISEVSPEACPDGDDTAYATSPMAADDDGTLCTFVNPDEVVEATSGTIRNVMAEESQQRVVEVELEGAATEALTELTGELVDRTTPQNQFAIIVDGEVVSRPMVVSPIPGGAFQIAGGDTDAIYDALAG